MIGGFQGFLISKGWKRCKLLTDKPIYKNGEFQGWPKEYNEDSNYVSSYGPIEYSFENSLYPDIHLWWGLYERGKPPVFCLSRINIYYEGSETKSEHDLWTILMQREDYETIYNLLLTRGTIIIYD